MLIVCVHVCVHVYINQIYLPASTATGTSVSDIGNELETSEAGLSF